MALDLLEKSTSIEQSSNSVWSLILEFSLRSIDLRSNITVRLDKEMIPESTEVLNNESGSISLTPATIGASASVSYSNESVNKESRTVEFCISSLKRNSKSYINTKKTIPFKWANSGLVPDDVKITVIVNSFMRKKRYYELIGINTKKRLIHLISSKPNSHFIFPKESQILEYSLPALLALAPILQEAPNTTGRNITWPTETDQWQNESGKEFLVAQMAKHLNCHRWSPRPIRLAICPFSLSVNNPGSRKFIYEMEIQARLGIRIKMLTPDLLYNVMRTESKAVSVYGSAVGFLLNDYEKPYEEQSVIIYLDDDSIKETQNKFESINSRSLNWDKYKEKHRIKFNKEELEYINRRLNELRSRINKKLYPDRPS